VEHLFEHLPGGQIGFLVAVNLLVFVLGFFIDFFEIAFIVVPILAPVAHKLGIDPVWFGVVLAMNLQTSYLTPPFGFALFFLRSVAPKADYTDRVTGRRIPAVTTAQIYKGSIGFVLLQLAMVAALLWRPSLASVEDDAAKVDVDTLDIQPERGGWGSRRDDDPMKRFKSAP
jgi:TRAP-type mannitol/chloroaromatic compound transport system permease large subunit